MTNILFAQILSLMTAFVSPDAVTAGPGAGRHHGDRGASMCERLACTDVQRARIDAIRAEHHEHMADERAEAKRVREALRAERASDSPDAETIASLQARLDALKAEMKQSRREAKTQISAVLTPEQRERLEAMKAKRKAQGKAQGKGKAHAKGHGKGKAHAKAERGGKGRALAKAERGAKGKAHAKRGAKGRAHAKAERGAKGKAHGKGLTAKRERPSKDRFTAG